jgi:hypothetical protein
MISQIQWLMHKFALSKAVIEEQQAAATCQQAHFAGIPHSSLKYLSLSFDPDCQPKPENYKDAMI